jgi:dihydroorotate dehydrogenase (fumarate)
VDLSTTYMGFELPHPLIPGASPMVDDLDTVRRLEDAGAPMVVMHSLFEEQIVAEQLAVVRSMEAGDESYGEAVSYFSQPPGFAQGPEDYLRHIARIKSAVSVPVIGSLNGVTESGWLAYARLIEQAGADGLELNIYELATDPAEDAGDIEGRALQIVGAVKRSVSIPVAVKLSPFYSALAHFCAQLDDVGPDAIVLFNRFFQPDIDVEQLDLVRVSLSSSAELLLRLRWLAILSGRVRASLAATGGVHTATDAIKAVMAGAHGVQMVSALLEHGPQHLAQVRADMGRWLDEHEYQSLRQMQGSMDLSRCANPKAYERAHYVRILQSWHS